MKAEVGRKKGRRPRERLMDPTKEIPMRVKSGEVRLGGGGQGNSVDSYKLIMLSGSH